MATDFGKVFPAGMGIDQAILTQKLHVPKELTPEFNFHSLKAGAGIQIKETDMNNTILYWTSSDTTINMNVGTFHFDPEITLTEIKEKMHRRFLKITLREVEDYISSMINFRKSYHCMPNSEKILEVNKAMEFLLFLSKVITKTEPNAYLDIDKTHTLSLTGYPV